MTTPKLDLTCKGRLEVHPFVTARKFEAMGDMIGGALQGGFAGEGAAVRLKETLSTTDGLFSFAHLISVRNLPKWDEVEPEWKKIASLFTVDDFEPTTFQSLSFNFKGLEHGADTDGKRVAPKVAELDTYQYAFGYSEEAIKAAIEKRGFKFGLSLERILSRLRPTVRELPDDMLQIAVDTDEFLVFRALVDGAVASAATTSLKGGVAPISGETIAANSGFSVPALRLGLSEIQKRKDKDGNSIKLAPSYYVVVALGQKESVEDAIEKVRSQTGLVDPTTGITYGRPAQGNLSRIAGVIESEFIEDEDAWFVTPAAGSTRKTGLVKLQLAGRTAPEILVDNWTGTLLRGGNGSSPFDVASFANDSVDLKNRQFTNAVQVTSEQMFWSDGSGS